MSLKEEFLGNLSKSWAKRGHPLPDGGRWGLEVAEIVRLANGRNARKKTPYLDTWIALFDEIVSWYFSLFSSFYAHNRREIVMTDFEKSVLLCLSKIMADCISVRRLVLAGYDTSALTLLRSTSEYMEVLVALIDKPSFSRAFVSSDTPEGAKEFWKEHLRSGKIRRRVRAAWRGFMQDSSSGAAQWFADWGSSSHYKLAGLAHPSLAGGIFTTMPLDSSYRKNEWLGIFGTKTEFSVETIRIFISFVFPHLLLSDFPFDADPKYLSMTLEYDERDEFHVHVKVGRGVLASAILAFRGEESAEYFSPKYTPLVPVESESPNKDG